MKAYMIVATAFVSGLWLAAPASAATQRCRDAHNHFVRCPPGQAAQAASAPAPAAHATSARTTPASHPAPAVTAATAAQRCHNSVGHVVRCGSPAAVTAGATPAPRSPAAPRPAPVRTAAATPRPRPAATPAVADTNPQGASARCHDNTYSHSASRAGTCARHGGVAQWLGAH